jgi:cation diffusion facilitator CzcD-associated flavoprotein CzcO
VGKRIVVVGSGATAVTLVPALAEQAAHVTMLQRSPTYITSLPSVDPFAEAIRRVVPDRLAFPAVRWKNVLQQIFIYQLSQRRPSTMKKLLRKVLDAQLPRATTSTATSARGTTRGTSACASSPTATSSGPSARAGRRSSRTRSTPSPSAASGWRRAPSSRRTSSSPPRA